MIIRYDRLQPERLQDLSPRAIVIGGNYTGFQHFTEQELAGMRRLFRHVFCPTLTICGSFQLMAETYGSEFGPLGSPGAAEDSSLDTDTPTPPDLLESSQRRIVNRRSQEVGYQPVRIVRTHPLFKSLGKNLLVYQLHGGEVKAPVDGFEVLAESDRCKIQALAHQKVPLFGTQFHPELYDDAHPDGRKVLKNFLRIAGVRR
jgi:GMP synthase-like glutamine amidotransferase